MNNDLISRSALIARIGDLGSDPEDDTTFLTVGQACAIAHKSIVEMVKAAPAVDAVEVVRCKDCKYQDNAPCPMRLSFNWTEDNDFCSYGERRANDGK